MQLKVCSALKPKHVHSGKGCCTLGFVKKTFWPLWLLFTHVSLQSIRASPLGACRATSAIYSVCVFNTSTPVTCQRPHKLVNPIGFVRLLRAERLIVRMGGRKKALGKERKKRRWLDEWCLWGSDNVCKDLRFLIKFEKAQISFFCVLHCYCFSKKFRVCCSFLIDMNVTWDCVAYACYSGLTVYTRQTFNSILKEIFLINCITTP